MDNNNNFNFNVLQNLDLSKRILIIGDTIVHVYKTGTCSRIAQEAPIPVHTEDSTELKLGGAANVLNNLVTMGYSADLLTLLGEEDIDVVDVLADEGLLTDGIISLKEYKAARITRYVADGKLVFRSDQKSYYEVSETNESEIMKTFKRLLSANTYDIIILSGHGSDYGKSILTHAISYEIINAAHAVNIPTLADMKKGDLDKFKDASNIRVDINDAEHFLNSYTETENGIKDVCRLLCDRLNVHTCFITLSDRRIAVYEDDGADEPDANIVIRKMDNKVSTIDTTGADETVLAAIAIGLANRWKKRKICQFAHNCFANVSGQFGMVPVNLVDNLQHKVITSRNEILNLKRIIPKKSVVVFLSGCFDLLHRGHVEYLRKAKALGDYLIVAINSDKLIKDVKGESRPICKVKQRCALLETIPDIDFIVELENDERKWVVETLDPDIFVGCPEFNEEKIRAKFPSIRDFVIIDSGVDYHTSGIIKAIKGE